MLRAVLGNKNGMCAFIITLMKTSQPLRIITGSKKRAPALKTGAQKSEVDYFPNSVMHGLMTQTHSEK
jgi:hypothetical protein